MELAFNAVFCSVTYSLMLKQNILGPKKLAATFMKNRKFTALKAADPESKGIVEWEGFLKIAHLSTIQGNPDEELLEAFRRFDKGHTGRFTLYGLDFPCPNNLSFFNSLKRIFRQADF